ncbi:MAG: methyltransferase domain-containing protein [Gammaproteobacteria bacterium]
MVEHDPTSKQRFSYLDWRATPLGQAHGAAEESALLSATERFFGQHLVQIGGYRIEPVMEKTGFVHAMLMDTPGSHSGSGGCEAEAHRLPFAAGSVSCLVLNHTLDFETEPHAVLREAARVLTGGGYVVVVGFNPISLWGIRRLMPWGRDEGPWRARFMSAPRLRDWLELLDFDVVSETAVFFRPPIAGVGLGERVMSRLGWMERLGARLGLLLGGSYVIAGRLRTIPLTPVRPRWRPRRGLAPGTVSTPSIGASRVHENKGMGLLVRGPGPIPNKRVA